MALPTDFEKELIEKFRGKVAELLTEEEIADDMYLVRWLRARDLNLELAEDMLRNALKWRKENNLDKKIIFYLAKDPYFQENFPFWIDGITKDGLPIHTSQFGKWDSRKLTKSGKSEADFVRHITHGFEELMFAIKKCREMFPPSKPEMAPISQFICIVNWEDFAWRQILNAKCVQNLLQIGSIYEAYYPEILHSCYFINCPSIIYVAMNLLKPVLASKTMNKIKCFGIDEKETWEKTIFEIVSAEQLRPQFGGTKENDFNPFHH